LLLAIYLNDHLAGATAGRDLARRAASSNRTSEYGPFLSELAVEIDRDRESLLAIMRALDVRVDRLKVAAGWSAEKLARLKPNGRLTGYSPLSRLIELEALALGVHGKLALWRSLDEVTGPGRAGDQDLAGLQRRAAAQLEQIEGHRRRAAAEALGEKRPAADQAR
jgi:hypothetical protein